MYLRCSIKKNLKQQETARNELTEAVFSALLIGGIIIAAIVWGYKTWLSWLEPKISDFRLWRSNFFSQNIYWLKPAGLSLGILVVSLAVVDFIQNAKKKGFKQAWEDTRVENRQGEQEKRIELPPFKLSSMTETWSGRFVIGMAIVLVLLVLLIIFGILFNLTVASSSYE
mgnify:FL=1